MESSNVVKPQNTIVGITGATGYISSHIILQLLQKGYIVRGSVRSIKKAKTYTFITEYLEKYANQFTLHEANLTVDGSFDTMLRGCHKVIHVASPFILAQVKNPNKEIIEPAVNGTLNVLRSCTRSKTVKRVVLTSSILSVVGDYAERGAEHITTEEDWNVSHSLEYMPYGLSKKLAEQAAWNYVRDTDKNLELVAINPAAVYGPVFDPKLESESIAFIHQIMTGKQPLAEYYVFIVDIRDVAAAHIEAMNNPKANKQRYICSTLRPLSLRMIAQELRKNFPDYPISSFQVPSWLAPVFPTFDHAEQLAKRNLRKIPKLSNKKIVSELGISFTEPEVAIRDMGKSLIEIGKVHKGYSKIAIPRIFGGTAKKAKL